MLKYLLSISKSRKIRFSNPNWQKDYIKIHMKKTDIEYNDTIVSYNE
jgi:hypothetical protein